MHRSRFRALISLDSLGGEPGQSLDWRRALERSPDQAQVLMLEAYCAGPPGSVRYFPAELRWDEERPPEPGGRAAVTITLMDDDAGTFLETGQEFRLWSDQMVGHGVISPAP